MLARPSLIESNLNELNYYPYAVSLDRNNGSCNALEGNCVPDKTEDVHLSVFNMITGTLESTALKNMF